jgi:hypothetical protein
VEQHTRLEQPARYQPVDPLLLPYLYAAEESDLQRVAEQLIVVHAGPIIRGIINYKLPASLDNLTWNVDSQDADDVYNDVVLELMTWLRKFKANPDENGVKNFCGFVAVLAYRACATYLRKKHPQRLKLKNKIHYVLTHNRNFALWKSDDDEWLCGFNTWRNHNTDYSMSRLELLRNDPRAFEHAALPCHNPRQMSPADLLAALFNWVQTPLKLDDVIATIADLLCIRDQVAETNLGNDDKPGRISTALISISNEVEQRIYLQSIWLEIGQLPMRQRCALLLNFTDSLGQGVIALLPIVGIASLREIAQSLEMTVEQLADLWNNLPLDDATIGLHLGVTRQQVINLRKSARERLLRRMKKKGGSRELVFSTARG